jgi:ABC-2 type transport system ATP-binding protein
MRRIGSSSSTMMSAAPESSELVMESVGALKIGVDAMSSASAVAGAGFSGALLPNVVGFVAFVGLHGGAAADDPPARGRAIPRLEGRASTYARPVSGPAIEVKGLEKSYGTLRAVRGVDLEVSNGEVFALLGPNGAGKTTIVEILEGHRPRSSGDVAVLGYDPGRGDAELKRRIGIVLQSTGVEPYLTVGETIELYRGYYPHPRPLDEVLGVVGLGDRKDVRVKKLSGGQQRRLDVAIGLAGDPDLLFLDEPTTGFDPSARRGAWEMISNLRSLGKTVFLTTHYMDEAQQLADRVAILVEGRVVAEGAPDILTGRDPSTRVRFRAPANLDLPPLPGAVLLSHGEVEVTTTEVTECLHRLTSWALEQSIELDGLTVTRPSLEDVYLELTREPAEAAT